MKTTKGGKVMNPTDAYRKELRKKELKRNKKERKKVREVGILKKDPEAIREQIRKLETMKADGALDKTRRHKKRQLEDTLNLVLKKRKEYEDKMREKGEEPIMFSHLSAPRRRTAEEEQKAKQLKPEDSVYFHPTLNPTGAPPPGKPPMYKSSIGPRIPLAGDDPASVEDFDGEAAIPIPPPPPLPSVGEGTSSAEEAIIPLPVPVPPPPPAPPRPMASGTPLLPPPPPPPPGPPPRVRTQVLPPPPPPPRQSQPLPPGIGVADPSGSEIGGEKAVSNAGGAQDGDTNTQEVKAKQNMEDSQDETLQQRPPPSVPPRPASSLPLPPPPPPPVGMLRPPQQGLIQPGSSLDVLPPGVQRLPPPPPPPGFRPSLSGPVLPTARLLPTGLPLPGPPRPPLGPPPMGPPPVGPPLSVARPPLVLPGAPPMMAPSIPLEDPARAAKASFVKSAAPTVVKRPLAQHTPELTSMVPASVLVRREPSQRTKPKSSVTVTSSTIFAAPRVQPAQPASKPQSIDDSYSAFLEDMKALGAFGEGDAS
ncbi:hypothetical protein GOP47_0027247 [Adiantum capillus-veneris]|nr:hypothetical protein GOP47_0027247 [Adiantum capillus-veneris]